MRQPYTLQKVDNWQRRHKAVDKSCLPLTPGFPGGPGGPIDCFPLLRPSRTETRIDLRDTKCNIVQIK